MFRKIHDLIEKYEPPNWVIYILFLIVILRIPSLFEPFHYGDEMIYITLGNAVRKGITLYGQIHDNKPPLLYLTAGLAGSVFWFRAILMFWSLVTTVLFYKLANKLFTKNIRLQKIAVLVFAIFTTLPLLEGQIANAENFMIGFTVAGFLLLMGRKSPSAKILLASGLMFSVAALFKMPAIFDIPAVIVYWILTTTKFNRKSLVKIVKNSFVLGVGFLTPILLSLAYYYLAGAFREYLIAAFLQNVGYLSSFRPDDQQLPFLTKNGPLLMRAGITGLVILGSVYLAKIKKVSVNFAFLTSWLVLTLFAVTLSERPYPHYLLQCLPPAALLLGILFASPKKEQLYALLPLGLLFFVPYYYSFWHYPVTSYYQHFLNYATHQIDRDDYLAGFGGHVPRDYEISSYLQSLAGPEDTLFVWGDNSTIYAKTRMFPPIRYVVDYHIADFSSKEEVVYALRGNPTTFIVVTKDGEEFKLLQDLLDSDYILVKSAPDYTIWLHLNQP